MLETELLVTAVHDTLNAKIEALRSAGVKGDKGDKGDRGLDGKDGKDGANGKDGADGRDGSNGADGRNGVDGSDGISVIDVDIDIDDHLVVKLSNGDIIDAGPLPVRDGEGGYNVQMSNAWQIKIQDFPPPSPYVNQLWFATNLRSDCG